MRQPHPWEQIGISRATWYRHDKPTEKPTRTNVARAARIMGFRSVRTFQRFNRVLALANRYRLLAVISPALDAGVEIGTLERCLAHPARRRALRKWLKEGKAATTTASP